MIDIARDLIGPMGVTAKMAALTSVLSIVFAFVLALGTIGSSRVIRWTCRGYVMVVRSIPQLALLILVFFGIPSLAPSLALPGFWAAVVGLTVSEAAYTAEIYRAAIQSVPDGQTRACLSLGMSRLGTLRYVVLPQAVYPAIPPTINMIIFVIKGTALASIITVPELTLEATELILINAEPVLTYGVLMLLYIALCMPLGYLGRYAERRYGRAMGSSAYMG